ncbi:MAG: nuclear transport factor 2 family protein [Halieaceae bacterium]|jgi:ketosteroid isomerase-like protein|nr:nuclear transport factor 2 family protein [Halieaceae bacterium]
MTLDEVADRMEIQQLVCKYSRAIDRRDFALLRTLYADDSTDEHGGMFAGSGADYVAWVSRVLETSGHTSHQILNHMIMVEGDYAEGEVYTLNVHIMENADGEQANVSTGSRYLDHYTKSSKGWQFLHRKTVADYTLNLPVPTDALVRRLREGAPVAGIKQDDPSYGFFRLIV